VLHPARRRGLRRISEHRDESGRFATSPVGWSTMKRGDLTVHGFRATFKTQATEPSNFPRGVIEPALAHVIGNKALALIKIEHPCSPKWTHLASCTVHWNSLQQVLTASTFCLYR
jgi:hypothetical protein